MKDYDKFNLSEDYLFASFDVENDNLTEQKFAKITKTLSIYILGNEAGDPHIHLCSDDKEDVVRVKLKENKYQRDSYEKGKERFYLNTAERKSLDKYMKRIENGNSMTNWEILCQVWNMINSQNPNKIDIKKVKQPSYIDIYE